MLTFFQSRRETKASKKKVTSVHLIITKYFFLFVIKFSNLTNILAL